MIDLIADGLLLAGCLGAGLYCFILSRKINKLNQFETGLGGAIAVLSAQVDDVQKTLAKTEKTAEHAGAELKRLLEEANTVAGRLDLMLAGLDDLPDDPTYSRPAPAPVETVEEEPEEPVFFSAGRQAPKTSPVDDTPKDEGMVTFSRRRTERVA